MHVYLLAHDLSPVFEHKNVFHNIAVEIKIGVEAEDAHKLCSVRIFGCGFSNGV